MRAGPGRYRKKKIPMVKPNLNGVMDAIFIFIFFLLMSANFTKVFELPSDVPIASPEMPKDKPLALTLKIEASSVQVFTGVPSRFMKSFDRLPDGAYDLPALKQYMIEMKKRHPNENTVLVEPVVDLSYEELVKVIDAARILQKTDEAIFVKDKDGMDVRLKRIFNNVVFTNIQS